MIFASLGVCIYLRYLPAPLTQVFTANRAASHDHFSPSRAEEAKAEEGPIELCTILMILIISRINDSEYSNDFFG